jgi:hypothetical protein
VTVSARRRYAVNADLTPAVYSAVSASSIWHCRSLEEFGFRFLSKRSAGNRGPRGFRKLSARPCHHGEDKEAAATFKGILPALIEELAAQHTISSPNRLKRRKPTNKARRPGSVGVVTGSILSSTRFALTGVRSHCVSRLEALRVSKKRSIIRRTVNALTRNAECAASTASRVPFHPDAFSNWCSQRSRRSACCQR